MWILIKRNLCLYFRDISDVILSLLSVFIAIGVYILFLSKMQIDMVESAVKSINIPHSDVMWLVNSWVVAGLLAITPVTSSLGGLGTLVHDLDQKIVKDFKASPVGRLKYPMSVLFSSCIIGTTMSLIPLAVYSLYIYITTGHSFTLYQYAVTLLLLIFTSVFSCSIMGFITSLIKSRQAFTSLSIIAGTLIGFLNGVYMPLGMLPEGVQTVLKFMPFGSSAVMFRSVLMSNAIDNVMGALPEGIKTSYLKTYGVRYYFGDNMIDLKWSLIYMAFWTLLALALYILSYNKRKEY